MCLIHHLVKGYVMIAGQYLDVMPLIAHDCLPLPNPGQHLLPLSVLTFLTLIN